MPSAVDRELNSNDPLSFFVPGHRFLAEKAGDSQDVGDQYGSGSGKPTISLAALSS